MASIYKNEYEKYIANTYKRFDVDIAYGHKEFLYDTNGKQYIDMGAGIAVNTFGAADRDLKQAVISQLDLISHTSNLYYTRPGLLLAKMLSEKSGMNKVFFSNSGAEANECAIKTARKYSFDKYGSGRHDIVTLKNGFHGRTITTLSATGQDMFHKYFDPFTQGFIYTEPEDEKAVFDAIDTKTVCAVMIEIIQGEGGVVPLSEKYIESISNYCKQNDVLLIIDEIQTGIGRTGAFFSYMLYDISPDIVTSAKGLAGGLPIGATLFNERTQDTLDFGSHGSTFGANLVSCAAACNVVSRITDELMRQALNKERFIRSMLKNADGIEYITGKGLMLGVKTVKNVSEIVVKCIEQGVLFLSAKDKVRMLPPLDIDMKSIEKAVNILKKVCAQ